MKNNSNQPESQKSPGWLRLAALLFVLGISIFIIQIPDEQTEALARYGVPGIFLLSVLANATLFLPAPFLILVFSMATRLDPWMVGVVSGLGATVGELSGYLAGFGGQAIIDDMEMYDRMVGWMERNGPLTVSLLAFIPNPFFDMTGIAAGALKMPVWKFMLWASIGKVAKTLVVALAAAQLITWPWLNDLIAPQ